MSDTKPASTSPIVCRICGYSPDELRKMVEPGKCDISRQWGQPHENGGEVTLQDLRGTQAIAQLSDVVVALERNQQAEGDGALLTLVRLLKNRLTGITGPVTKLLYDRKTGRFAEVGLGFGEEQAGGDEFDDETEDATT